MRNNSALVMVLSLMLAPMFSLAAEAQDSPLTPTEARAIATEAYGFPMVAPLLAAGAKRPGEESPNQLKG